MADGVDAVDKIVRRSRTYKARVRHLGVSQRVHWLPAHGAFRI